MSMICNECWREAGTEKEIVEKYNIPFVCSSCGNIHMKWKALNGVVFIWQKPVVEKIGSLYVPEASKDSFKTTVGVVLSAGKGCILQKTGEFMPCEVNIGDVVKFDNSTPWEMPVEVGEKSYNVKITNMLNINAVAI